jgi:hypothetical protein
MDIKSALPTIYARRYSPGLNEVWDFEYKPANGSSIDAIALLITLESDLAMERPIADFRQHIQEIFDDLVAAKFNPATVLPNQALELLLLLHGTTVAHMFNLRGILPENFDTFTQSLYGKKFAMGEEYTPAPDLLWRFLQPHYQRVYPHFNIFQVCARWLGSLFYYSRSMGGLIGLAESFVSGSIKLLMAQRATTPERAELAVQLHGWGRQYEHPRLVQMMYELNNHFYGELNWASHPGPKQTLGIQLALTSPNQREQQRFYAEVSARSELQPVMRMHLECELPQDFATVQTNFGNILAAVRAYAVDAEFRLPDLVERAYEKSRIIKSLDQLLIKLCRQGAATELTALLTAYYNPQAEPVPSAGLLYIVPNAEAEVIYCGQGQAVVSQQENRSSLSKLVEVMNRALSQLHTLRGDADQVIAVPARELGVPQFEYGSELEQKMSAYYRLSHVLQFDTATLTGLCPSDLNLLPLQALLLKETGFTFPLHVSLQPKADNPTVQHVLLWQGNTTTSEYEVGTLGYLFRRAGISVTVLREGEATKADFLAAYQSATYDVLWVSSHGALEYYKPDTSHFLLSDSETVSIQELADLSVVREARRLLFLNVCEGGANTQIGGFQNVGFGHLLSATHQDVLSHLWMADPKVALVFGVLIAIKLSEPNTTFFDAYTFATSGLIAGHEYIISQLQALIQLDKDEVLDELLKRVRYSSSLEKMNILRWGSPVYYM